MSVSEMFASCLVWNRSQYPAQCNAAPRCRAQRRCMWSSLSSCFEHDHQLYSAQPTTLLISNKGNLTTSPIFLQHLTTQFFPNISYSKSFFLYWSWFLFIIPPVAIKNKLSFLSHPLYHFLNWKSEYVSLFYTNLCFFNSSLQIYIYIFFP